MLVNEQTVDCIWSDYGPWSKCSKSCGFGTQKRKRFFAVAAKGPNGKPCLGAPSEERSCNQKACVTTTTRRPTTSTSLRTTNLKTSGTTTFFPPQTTFSFTENDLNPEIETTYPPTIISTQDTAPPAPQINENTLIFETTTIEPELVVSTIQSNSDFGRTESTVETTTSDSTNTILPNTSTTIPVSNNTSTFLDDNSLELEPISPQIIDKIELNTTRNRLLDAIEIKDITIVEDMENVEENEIQDVGLESSAKALTNTVAFNESNAKETAIESDVTSSIQLSPFQKSNVTKELSKFDDILNSSAETSSVVSATNSSFRNNSNTTQTPKAQNSVDQLEDKLENNTSSLDDPETDSLPISHVKALASPSVSLNGDGDVDSE